MDKWLGLLLVAVFVVLLAAAAFAVVVLDPSKIKIEDVTPKTTAPTASGGTAAPQNTITCTTVYACAAYSGKAIAAPFLR